MGQKWEENIKVEDIFPEGKMTFLKVYSIPYYVDKEKHHSIIIAKTKKQAMDMLKKELKNAGIPIKCEDRGRDHEIKLNKEQVVLL